MSPAFVALLLSIIPFNESKMYVEIPNLNEKLEQCVSDIITRYFYRYKELTYIDANSDNQKLIKTIHSIKFASIVSKTTKTKLIVPNESYLITAGSTCDFNDTFANLVKEPSWNPQTRYLIIIQNIQKDDLQVIFDVLLKFHIINVVVLIESNTSLFSYNPFENYSCGRRYDRIIEYGECSKGNKDLYPYKLATGLINCTLRVTCMNWPPYSINQTLNNEINQFGVEQYVLSLLSNLEHFNVNVSYSDEGDIFTVIDKNMSVVGPLNSLQTGASDIMLGGLLLTHQRFKVFDYIHGHLDYVEDFRYQVQKATAVPAWKTLYMEFGAIVWITFFVSFLMYFLFFIIVIRPKDTGELFLKMLASLFLASSKIKGSSFTKYLFIAWVWFAYLVNSYYVSILVSLVTHPIMNYQISDEMDIMNYKLEPCISTAINEYSLSVADGAIETTESHEFDEFLKCTRIVSQDKNKYTLTLNTIYTYHEQLFYDEKGDPMVYTFNRPHSKIIYVMYVYKGFPLLETLSLRTLRLRENGLIDHHLRNLYWMNNERYIFKANMRKTNITIPWYILICGYSSAVLIFIVEVLIKWVRRVIFHQF